MTNLASNDWRSAFRLHALDMDRAAPGGPGPEHWMLQDEGLRDWIAKVAKDFELLIAAGGDPFNGQTMTPWAIIARLGFAELEKPRGLLAMAKFTARMVAVSTRESIAAQREAARLRAMGRPGARG